MLSDSENRLEKAVENRRGVNHYDLHAFPPVIHNSKLPCYQEARSDEKNSKKYQEKAAAE